MEKKAKGIQADYESKIRGVDHEDGRVMAKFRSYGDVRCLVAGGYGEFNADFLLVMRDLAEARIRTDMKTQPLAGGQALEHIRRMLSVAAWRAQANLLLNGLGFCGPGGAEAYRNRNAVLCAYDEGIEEMRAAWEVMFGWRDRRGSLRGDGRGPRGL